MEQILAKLLTSIIEGSITYGPYATMVTYLWLSERAERRSSQEAANALLQENERKRELLTDRTYNALNDNSTAMVGVGAALTNVLSTMTTVKEVLLSDRHNPDRGG